MLPMQPLSNRLINDLSRTEYHQHGCYWTDGARVFRDLHNLSLKGADPATFEYFLGLFGRDATSCFICRDRAAGADPETFTVLNHCFAVDKGKIFAAGDKAKGHVQALSAPGEVRALGSGKWHYGIDAKHKTANWNPGGYIVDGGNIYHFLLGFGMRPLQNVDADSFEACANAVNACDKNRVYFRNRWLRKADRASWKMCLDSPHCAYSKDDRSIFWNEDIVDVADPKSFTVLSPAAYGGGYLASDGLFGYRGGFRCSLQELEGEFADRRREFFDLPESERAVFK